MTTTTLYRPFAGFVEVEIDTSPKADAADALACAEAHAAYIVRLLAPYVDTAWQAALYDPAPDAPARAAAADGAAPCDVAGCGRPGETVWLGWVPSYPVTLCAEHRREVRRDPR